MWIKLFHVHGISRSVHPFAVDKLRHGHDRSPVCTIMSLSPRSPCFCVSAWMPVEQPCHGHQPSMSLPSIGLCVFQELFIIADLFAVGSSVPSSLPICLPALPHTTLHSQPRHWGTDPSWDRNGQKLCFPSCQACKAPVTRGCAGQMGFPFGCKGELSLKSTDLLWGILWRVLAPTPAANSKASTLSRLFSLVTRTIWADGFEGIKKTCLAAVWPFLSLCHALYNNSSFYDQLPLSQCLNLCRYQQIFHFTSSGTAAASKATEAFYTFPDINLRTPPETAHVYLRECCIPLPAPCPIAHSTDPTGSSDTDQTQQAVGQKQHQFVVSFASVHSFPFHSSLIQARNWDFRSLC